MMNNNILSRISQNGSALQVSLLRIAIGVHIFFVSSSRFFELAVLVDQPRKRRTYFPEIVDEFIANHLIAGPFSLVTSTQILAILVVAGFLLKFTLPLLLISFTSLWSYYYWVTNYPCHWVYMIFPALILCFSRSGDRLSLDSFLFRKRKTNQSVDSQNYRWPVELCSLWFVYIYAAAAFAKLFPIHRGIQWLEGGTIQNLMWSRFLESPLHFIFHEPLFNYASSYWVFLILGIVAILTESIVLIILFTNRWNFLILGAIIGMHIFLILTGVSGFLLAAIVLGIALIPPSWFPDYKVR